jgi:hypothetical protein
MPSVVRFYKVVRNYDDTVATKEVVKKFPVITDEVAETTEVINLDCVELVGLHVNTLQKSLQLRLALGGYDSQDNFHKAPGFKLGVWRLDRAANEDAYDQWVEGRRIWNFDQILQFLHNRKGLRHIAHNQWGVGHLIESETDTDLIPNPVGPKEKPIPPPDDDPV